MNLFEDLKSAIERKDFEIDNDEFLTINLEKEIPDSFLIEIYREEDTKENWRYEGESCWRIDTVEEMVLKSVCDSEVYKDSDINLTTEQEKELIKLIDFAPIYY